MKSPKAKGHNGRVRVWPVHTTDLIYRNAPQEPKHRILGDHYDFFVPAPVDNTIEFPVLDINYKCPLENQ